VKAEPGSSRRPDWPLAVVFGAGGLGMAVARRLGQTHRLLIGDRDGEHLGRQVEALNACGHDATGVPCDVTSAPDIEALAETAARMGGVRSLAYVVGLSPALGDFGSIIAVNLVGATRVVATFRERMAASGAAVFISSSAAHMPAAPAPCSNLLDDPLDPDLLPALAAALGESATPALAYVLSKKALIRLCRRSAPAWGERQARIVSLSPGLIATPQGAIEYRNSPGKRALFDAVPLGREATMLEIAGVAEFLLSDQASYISGIDLLVDGGLVAGLAGAPA